MRAPGRKRRPGRPSLPPGEVRTVQLGLHVTAEEAELLRQAVERLDARSFSAWARQVLVDAARRTVGPGANPGSTQRRSSGPAGHGLSHPRSTKDT